MLSGAIALVIVVSTTVAARQKAGEPELATVLQRVGDSVARYFARAQSLVCLESVTLIPFGGTGLEAMSREVESELSLAWSAASERERAGDIQMLRQVLRVNGRPPRPNDPRDCTTPEQNATETAPLSMLLPESRERYRFTLAGTRRLRDKQAVLVDFVEKARAKVASTLVPGKDDCISYTVDGGSRGRLWIDIDSYDVLRLEQHVGGMIDIPLPRELARRSSSLTALTLDRADTTIDFQPVTFSDPDEVLVLPVSVVEVRETRGGGTPRLRTTTEYTDYRRFLTGTRIVR
ncbi:MAG TPA: hypothetical protein VF147_03280 [Vicinamibacterales bacterium]